MVKLLLSGELSEVLRLSSEETLDSKRDTASLFQTFLILLSVVKNLVTGVKLFLACAPGPRKKLV